MLLTLGAVFYQESAATSPGRLYGINCSYRTSMPDYGSTSLVASFNIPKDLQIEDPNSVFGYHVKVYSSEISHKPVVYGSEGVKVAQKGDYKAADIFVKNPILDYEQDQIPYFSLAKIIKDDGAFYINYPYSRHPRARFLSCRPSLNTDIFETAIKLHEELNKERVAVNR